MFTKSPDGKKDWIVYHAHINPSNGKRNIRIQKFSWNADGSPNFGKLISLEMKIPVPSGEH